MKLMPMNTTIMTGGAGTYRMDSITAERARSIWKTFRSERLSAIGHEATANVLTVILGERIEVNRIGAVQEPGGLVIALKMRERIPEGKVIQDVKVLESIGYDLYLIAMERSAK